MNAGQANYRNLFFFSLLLHIIVLLALIVSIDLSSPMPVLQNSDQNTEVINAMVMNAPLTPQKIVPQPERVIPRPTVSRPEPEEKPLPAPPKKPDAIAIADKKQKKIEKDKIAKQLLSDIKKEADHQKKLKQKAITSAFEKEMKQLTAKSIQRQMLQEQRNLAGARSQKVRGEVNKYKALILQIISQNWIVPPSVDKNLSARLLIRVAPGGVVLDVEVVKSSGDEGLDRSVRAAVFKSSPLPVPPDAEAFEQFRQFVLKVKPESILSPDSWAS